MKVLAIVIGLIFLAGVVVAGCFALVNDEDSLGRIQLVSHHDYRGDCDDYRGNCRGNPDGGSDGNTGYDGEGGQGGDTDQRGDHNCRNFCFYGVPLPGSQPESLFPVPTPGGVQKIVLATIEAGIGLGRLFANATIDFVSSIMVGIA